MGSSGVHELRLTGVSRTSIAFLTLHSPKQTLLSALRTLHPAGLGKRNLSIQKMRLQDFPSTRNVLGLRDNPPDAERGRVLLATGEESGLKIVSI